MTKLERELMVRIADLEARIKVLESQPSLWPNVPSTPLRIGPMWSVTGGYL